jgi:hypothetical protein
MKTSHTHARDTLLRVMLSFVIGMTALVVSFVAASLVEVPGQNSVREIVAACLVGTPYLAFCQFWVAPRGMRGFRAKWPTLAAMVAPLFAILPFIDRGAVVPQGIPFAIFGCLGSLVGAVVAGRVDTQPILEAHAADAFGRLRSCRRLLFIGVVTLVAVTLLVAVGVIPPLMADLAYTTGFRAHGFAAFLGGTAALNLLVAVMLAVVAMRPALRGALWVPAVLALLLALLFAFSSGIRSQNPALHTASILLVVCAFSDLIVTALVTAASVFAQRVGTQPDPERQPNA